MKVQTTNHPWADSEANFHFFEVHGDFGTALDADAATGRWATDGYRRRLPDGRCLHVPEHNDVTWYGMFNDVRVAGAPYDIWMHVEFETAAPEQSCRRAGQLWLDNPARSVALQWGSSNGRQGFSMDANKSRFDLFDPAQFDAIAEDSVAWFTSQMPVAARMLPNSLWVHLHRMRAQHFLLQHGPPSEALCRAVSPPGFESAWLSQPSSHLASLPLRAFDGGVGGVEELYAALVEDDATICRDNPRVPTSVHVRSHPELQPDSSYDRQGAFTCRPWHFAKGDTVTVVVLIGVPWGGAFDLVGMHVNPFFYIDLDDPHETEQDWTVYSEPLNPPCQRGSGGGVGGSTISGANIEAARPLAMAALLALAGAGLLWLCAAPATGLVVRALVVHRGMALAASANDGRTLVPSDEPITDEHRGRSVTV